MVEQKQENKKQEQDLKQDENKNNGFKKVEQPEIIKFEKIGDEIHGKFISISPSKKYNSSFALHFLDVTKENKLSCIFINAMGQELLNSQSIKKDDEFLLVFTGEKPNKEGTQKYSTYDLYVK